MTANILRRRPDARVGIQRKALVVQNTEGKLLSKELVLELAKTGKIRGAQDPERVMRFIASTERVDRTGDIIRQDWDLKSYQANPVILWDHDQGKNIGKSLGEELVTDPDDPYFKAYGRHLAIYVEFMPADIDPFADKVFKMYNGGWLKGGSVGYVPVVIDEVLDEEQRKSLGLGPVGVVFEKSELAEFSLCTVPANQEALATEMKSAPEDVVAILKELGYEKSSEKTPTQTAAPKPPVAAPKPGPKTKSDSSQAVEEALNCANGARDLGENALSGGRDVVEAAESLMDILNGDLDYNAYDDAAGAVGDLIDALNGVELDMDEHEDDEVSSLQEDLAQLGKQFEEMGSGEEEASASKAVKTKTTEPSVGDEPVPPANEQGADSSADLVPQLVEQLEALLVGSTDPKALDALSVLEDLEVALGIEDDEAAEGQGPADNAPPAVGTPGTDADGNARPTMTPSGIPTASAKKVKTKSGTIYVHGEEGADLDAMSEAISELGFDYDNIWVDGEKQSVMINLAEGENADEVMETIHEEIDDAESVGLEEASVSKLTKRKVETKFSRESIEAALEEVTSNPDADPDAVDALVEAIDQEAWDDALQALEQIDGGSATQLHDLLSEAAEEAMSTAGAREIKTKAGQIFETWWGWLEDALVDEPWDYDLSEIRDAVEDMDLDAAAEAVDNAISAAESEGMHDHVLEILNRYPKSMRRSADVAHRSASPKVKKHGPSQYDLLLKDLKRADKALARASRTEAADHVGPARPAALRSAQRRRR